MNIVHYMNTHWKLKVVPDRVLASGEIKAGFVWRNTV